MAFTNYRTRALASSDPRFAAIFEKIGGPKPAATLETKDAGDDDLSALRDEYKTKTGKRAFHGWNANELREKIAAAASQED